MDRKDVLRDYLDRLLAAVREKRREAAAQELRRTGDVHQRKAVRD